MLSEVEGDEIEDEKRSKTSIKGFVITGSMSEMVSLRERENTVGAKVFLAGGHREEVLEIKRK